ncbi:unnamed protein product [Protopolystoma xenopodis]|uniref:Uncharacterized protein n=1 Tax=Protopolystoma xenopodis TaxID=117903 RepID=A0A3S5AFN9_9PLAT|nr:unnamed protein product [Protopolystoma xenopodis]
MSTTTGSAPPSRSVALCWAVTRAVPHFAIGQICWPILDVRSHNGTPCKRCPRRIEQFIVRWGLVNVFYKPLWHTSPVDII